MALTCVSRTSSLQYLYIRFMVNSRDLYIFTFHKLHKSGKKEKEKKGKAPPKLIFYKY